MQNSRDLLHFNVGQMNRLVRQINLTVCQKYNGCHDSNFKTHGGTDLVDVFFSATFIFGVKGADDATASILNHGKVRSEYKAH